MPETDIPSRKSKSQRLLDFMSPSERVLRVHRKNFACARALRLQMEEYDAECRRALRKVEQEIFEVYFDEYLPLKAQARSTANYFQHLNTVCYIPNVHMRNSRANVKFPLIKSTGNVKLERDKGGKTIAKQKRATASATSAEMLPSVLEKLHLSNPGGRPSPESRTSSPLLDAGVTEERLRIIQSALALSSQPPPPAPKRKKKKDRSRKIPIITITEVSGEEESRSKIDETAKTSSRSLEKPGDNLSSKDKVSSLETRRRSIRSPASANSPSGMNKEVHFPSTFVKSLLQWRPSLARNRIFNDDETEFEESVSDLDRASFHENTGPLEVSVIHDATSSLNSSRASTPEESGDYSSQQYGSSETTSSGLSSPDLDMEFGHDFPDEAFSSVYSYSQSSFVSSDDGM